MVPMSSHRLRLQWDVFCRVIDNFGDVGVCWRLCRSLASRGQQIRLWIDRPDALQWLAPGASAGQWPGIAVMPWQAAWPTHQHAALSRADVWVEAFGCEPPDGFIRQQRAQWPAGEQAVWVNLEYLSAEPYVERMHRLPSPLMSGPAQGWTRWFFYPGFSPGTGGLLRDAVYPDRLEGPNPAAARAAWRAKYQAVLPQSGQDCWVSLFCYEPEGLPWLLQHLHADPAKTLLITPGRAQAAVQAWLHGQTPALVAPPQWHGLPWVPQPDFDAMLAACDLNCVRGEDSLVRALWAGQPFVWQIYPQQDQAHHAKLEAFLDWLQAPPDWRALHHDWNGIRPATHAPPAPSSDALWARLPAWKEVALAARDRLLRQTDLTTRLLEFVTEKR
jgi:uncharacterized repeat protein (TIGR03837 family)